MMNWLLSNVLLDCNQTMAIKTFRAGRQNYAVETYVGVKGELYYVEDTGQFRLCDGVTPGGRIVGNLSIAEVGTTPPASPLEGELWYNPNTYELWVYHNGAFLPTIDLATDVKIGGVKLGPGVITNAEGQIIIDSTGLQFSFGDFAATVGTYTDEEEYAVLSSINANEDIVLASNGTGSVHVVGEFKVHPTNGGLTATLESTPAFTVQADGQVIIHVTQDDAQLGAVEIVGSTTGDIVPPGINGTMLHITGQVEDPCRVYFDGNGDYVSLVARRWNGNFEDGRTAVLANDYVLRINATAQTTAGMGSVAMAQISIQALENQTATAQGSKITFTATPIGSAASARVDVATITTADGVSATKFTGPLTGNVTGDVSGNAGTVTNGVYTTGTQSIGGAKTFTTEVTAPRIVETGIRTVDGGTGCTIDFSSDSLILWDTPSGTATVTLQNYTAGATVKLIIRVGATSRDINYGVATVNNSTTGSTSYNGSGGGAASIANQCVVLTYICVDTTSTNCYVSVAIEPLVP